jgi:hypothetical protein
MKSEPEIIEIMREATAERFGDILKADSSYAICATSTPDMFMALETWSPCGRPLRKRTNVSKAKHPNILQAQLRRKQAEAYQRDLL